MQTRYTPSTSPMWGGSSCFPPGHLLHVLLNSNTVRESYCTMGHVQHVVFGNMGQVLQQHNSKVFKDKAGGAIGASPWRLPAARQVPECGAGVWGDGDQHLARLTSVSPPLLSRNGEMATPTSLQPHLISTTPAKAIAIAKAPTCGTQGTRPSPST